MTLLTTDKTWTLREDLLEVSLRISQTNLTLAKDYALHRLRTWRAMTHGVIHPTDISVSARGLSLKFAPGALRRHTTGSVPFARWRDEVLLPLLDVLVSSLDAGITGFGSPGPINGKWVPPVSWFLPALPSQQHEAAVARDLAQAHRWVLEQGPRLKDVGEVADRRLIESLSQALEARDLRRLKRRLESDLDDASRRRRLEPRGAGLLRLLTEAELLERAKHMYRFRVLDRDDMQKRELHRVGPGQIVEVDTRWRDPHFPEIGRPSPQELWDALTDASRTTPVFALFDELPNPLEEAHLDVPRARWIHVHKDQPYLTLVPEDKRLPRRGWLLLDSAGDNTLMRRKRAFTEFAGDHPGLERLLSRPPASAPFKRNCQARDDLESVILDHRGVYPVQGPPGTGKTYLATQVVWRLLTEHSGARVLVCAKEHFALDHILRKIVGALGERGLPHRPWRSVSQARLRRARDEVDLRWLPPSITRELAGRAWVVEAKEWTRWQASTSDEHDRRLATLGQQSANLFFCTTMDAAMVDFLGRDSFDLVIVEEAGKCYPSELLHAVCLGRTTLLIGDHMQLPPYQERQTRAAVIAWQEALDASKDDEAWKVGMEARFGDVFSALRAMTKERTALTPDEEAWSRPFEFLFDRLRDRHRIEEQFRMEAPLSRLIGEIFYGKPFIHRKGELVAAGVIEGRPLGDAIPARFDVPLVWLDTPHMLEDPSATEDPEKRGLRDNRYELEIVIAYLRQLRSVDPIDMVILTPYNAQKSLMLGSDELREVCESLSELPFEQIVRTTDEYQGREAELTVLSLVRNNSLDARAWGFMTEKERLNVMFSRTRFRQVVVGCSAHIERHAQEASWLHKVWHAYKREASDQTCAIIHDAREVRCG